MNRIHKKTKKYLHFMYLKVLLVFIFLIPSISSFCQESDNLILTPDQTIVYPGMQGWLNSISDEQLIDYGFNNRAEFNKIKIGMPLYIYTIHEDSLVEQKGNDKIKFEFKNEWFIPLYVDNRICCFLFLKKDHDQQKVIGIGANLLAVDLNEEEELFSNTGNLDGILLIPPVGAKFLIKGKENLTFYPLGVTKCKFKTKENNYLKKKEVFDLTYSQLINR
jgi:hypothetical protein